MTLAAMACFAGEVIIVANKKVSDATLSKDDVKKIFLGEKTVWKDNSKVVFVMLNNNRDDDVFARKYLGRSFQQFMNFWRQQLFTGNGQIPQVFKNSKDLEAFIGKTEGAVGYISSDDLTADLKKLDVK
jgi:ABC-type phosphate transport system substrate-binding protein